MLAEARLWDTLEGGRVHCHLCAHLCRIAPEKFGVCGVRENQKGRLVTYAYGRVIAAHVDPIEKKPLYHFQPGTSSFSVATVGCNFRCPFCQNWEISQAQPEKDGPVAGYELAPQEIVAEAKAHGCRSISYTYTEPTIFFEYAYDTAELARGAGLWNVFVTNGYMTDVALRLIQPYLDAANVDLKAFRDETYKKVCGARLQPVLDSIILMRELGIWVEVTTLVVPGLNDSEAELRDIARFIAGVSVDIPWHVSRFHPDYQYTQTPATPVETLERARALGREVGLRYVYVGNVSGEGENTDCPQCGRRLISRIGFSVQKNDAGEGVCPECGLRIAGVF
jgi:pyruvate formate lyase activating enzyme